MTPARICAALMLALLLPGSAPGAEPDETYYPLKPGARWEYQIASDQGAAKTLVITNLPPRDLNGKTVIPRKWDLGGKVFYQFMGKDEGGIYRFAEQDTEKGPPTMVTPREYDLKYPLTEGTTWDITAPLGGAKVPVNLTIESVTEKVTVPAGTYKNCVKVRQAGEEKGKAAVTAYEWYAPQVGVVKSLVILRQKAKDGTMATENRTYQLQSFKP